MDKLSSRITSIKNDITRQEEKIIAYLQICNLKEVTYWSISEFSATVGVGDATALRFCRKLGFKGYQDFKLFLAQETAFDDRIVNSNIAEIIAEEMISTLKSTLELTDLNVTNRVAKMFMEARSVYIFGGGSSGITAMEMRSKLIKSGFNVVAETDPHFQSMITSTLNEKDLIVFISVSGSNKDLISVAQIAVANKVKCVMITNYLRSPLAEYATEILHTVSKEDPTNGSSLISKVSQLFTINVLCNSINGLMGETAKENFKKTAQAVVDKLV